MPENLILINLKITRLVNTRAITMDISKSYGAMLVFSLELDF